MSEMREPHDERLGPDCGIKRCHFTVISTKGRNLSHAKSKFDCFVKSPKMGFFVIPAQAGIQENQGLLDPSLSTLRSIATAEDGRRGDGSGGFLRTHQA